MGTDMGMNTGMHMGMEMSLEHVLLMALVRGLLVAGALLSIGASGFYCLVFAPALSSMKGAASGVKSAGESRARMLAAWASILFMAANAVSLFHEASMMSGLPVLKTLPALPIVLLRTHFGMVWLLRTTLLAALIIAVAVRLPMVVILFLSASAASTISLVSHAADAGNLSLPTAADTLHVLMISLWLGGLTTMCAVAGRAMRGFDGLEARKRFLYEVLSRFSHLATVSVVVVLATGIYAAHLHLPGFLAITQPSTYGKILRAKHIFAVATIGAGGVSRFFVLPGLKKAGTNGRLFRVFWAALAFEMAFAAATIAFAAVLSQEMPPFVG